MNWLLILVIILFLGSTYSGYRKGLFKTIFSIASIIIAILITTFVSPYIAKQINGNVGINSKIREQVIGLIDNCTEKMSDEEQEEFIDNMPVPKYIKGYLKKNNNLQVYQERSLDSFSEYIVDELVRIIINLITFVIVYFAIRIGLLIVTIMGNIITNLPVIEQFDGMGGTLLGGVQGIIEIWILFIIITFLSQTEFGMSAMRCIENNTILSILYDNNVIMRIMYQFMM